MMLHPNILALSVTSLLVCLMLLYSAFHGFRIVRKWDLNSGSEFQLELERRTYLVSNIVSWFLALQLISLFLFIYTADRISTMFVGAMCAVGALTVNHFGYPTLILKIVTFVLGGLWLVLNNADNQGYDYPLIRKKYLLLLLLAPIVLAETVVQGAYFSSLTPDIITSCCGSLFSPAGRGIASEIAGVPPIPMLVVFYASSLLTIAVGLRFYRRGNGGYVFAALSGCHFLVAIVAVISVISLYIYQMPSHHCPFCILRKEYHYVGYPLYVALLTGGVTGLAVGALLPFRSQPSLQDVLPRLLKRLSLATLVSCIIVTLLASGAILLTSFTLVW